MTRRDCLDRVLAGLGRAREPPGIRPIKVNTVAMRDFTEEEILDFAGSPGKSPTSSASSSSCPSTRTATGGASTSSGPRCGRRDDQRLVAARPVEDVDASSTSRRYRFADGKGEVGFINPVTEPFCAHCNRVRLTADGQLRTCLFSIEETDLRTPLRGGASDEELAAIVREAVWRKELKHRINEPGFRPPARTMSAIGG